LTEAAVILLAFIVYMAYKTDETFVWLAGGMYAGVLSPIWWDIEMAYGLAAFMLCGVCVYKAISQLITGQGNF